MAIAAPAWSDQNRMSIQDLFEPKSEVVYLEGMPETSWLYPFGEIIGQEADGLASYVIYIEDSYQVEQQGHVLRASFDSDFQVDVPLPFMEIKQVPNIGVEEVWNDIFNEIDLDRIDYVHDAQPEADFPYYVIERYDGAEWDSLVSFTYLKDNTRGGVFVITTQHSLEATEGHGARFRNYVRSLEILD